MATYAELHCHTNFSFLDGASAPDELVERAVELGLSGLAVTDHGGLYGVVRFASAAREAGLRPVIGIEIELADAAVPDPAGVVIPARRTRRVGRGGVASLASSPDDARRGEGLPARPRPNRARLPGHRDAVREDLRGVGEGQRGPHLVLLARDAAGYRSLCRLVSRANMAGTKSMPRFSHELLAANTEGLVALSGCREGEIARRLLVGDRAGARAAAERYARLFAGGGGGAAAAGGSGSGRGLGTPRGFATGPRAATPRGHGRGHGRGDGPASAAFFLEMQHHLLPDDDWLVTETARLAGELGLPVVVTNDVHYAYPEGREMQDVLTAIRHGRTLAELRDLRRPDGESYLKSGEELLAMPPGMNGGGHSLAGGVPGRAARDGGPSRRDGPSVFSGASAGTAAAWVEGIGNAGELAASCSVDLGFERYRFPGFPVPKGHTPFSYLEDLCHDGARRRYHPISSPVVKQLAHELDVIERTGLAEFFLICWDLMRVARELGIPAQGRGSAANSIVAYVLGITRVDPIRHHLLFERFINEGRTSYPDIDIDFSSERREEIIQYVYRRYGPEHTGMVCNLVTYRARSAVREVGYALGFPRPLVDRVAKALETYDSVMVRRDLEADGGFGQFFADTVEREAAGAGAGVAAGAGAGVGGGAGAGVAAGAGAGVAAGAGAGVAAGGGAAVGGGAGAGGVAAGIAAADEVAMARGFTDRMGQLNHPRGGWIASGFGASGVGGADGGRGAFPYTTPTSAMEKVGVLPVPGVAADALERPVLRSVRRVGAESGAAPGPEAPNPTVLGPLGRMPGSEMVVGSTYHSPGEYKGIGVGGAASASQIDLGGGSAAEQERRLARRRQGDSDDEGGPGDSAASIAWLAAERVSGRAAKESARALEAKAATPPPPPPPAPPAAHSSVATSPPTPTPAPPETRRGSAAALPHWERWLAFCARIDGFPRHLSIHSGGMLVTAAPLIDIAPLERATMADRVVVQFDKRDVETLKLIKLDLLGLGMLAAIDETLQLIELDCAARVDLDRLPEDVPEVFQMLQAADTVGVFQVESRAQMQTLPKSRPQNLDDLVVEVAIIRPGPIQGNAVHPYLRRRQGLEPVEYLHPSLAPVLRETLGVILYQEQVMNIAITVAGFTPGESDGFRRAMGTWRSSKEMEKLHQHFVDGCRATNGLTDEQAEELFRRVAAFASFGFAKSHAAAFARTAYESAFLKLFYPAQFTVGLINAQPMGFYPVEVLINDAKRHGVAVLPVDINASSYKTTTEWVGRDAEPGRPAEPGRDAEPGRPAEPLPEGAGIARRPQAVRSSGCILPSVESRRRWTPESATGYGIRLGLALVKGVGDEHAELLDAELARGSYETLADVAARTELPEEVIERLIRAGALDSLGRPRRELLWQLREVMGATRGRRSSDRIRVAAGRPMNLQLPPTPAPELPALTERERLGDSYAVLSLDARRQVISLFRPALDRLGAVTNASLADRGPGPVRLGGLVVTRQHPMTARGTVFLALEDETGMANVTLWPDAWARLRGVVRRHALLYVDGTLQREGNVVNVVARDIRPLPAVAETAGGPAKPDGVRALGYSGMRRG
jgi:DNA polymerase III alpha subunit